MKYGFLFSCVCVVGVLSAVYPAQAYGLSATLLAQTQSSVLYVEANATSFTAAENFVGKLADQGISFLSDKNISEAKQKAEFRKLLNRNFDMTTIARFSLGRHWRSATKAQRDEYMKLFKAMIVDVYSSRFKDYQGQKISIVGSREEGKRDILVHSVLKQDSGPDVKVDWRVRNRDGRYKVIDVIVEGVSMAVTQRSDFSSVVQRGGGKMEALLVHLRAN